MKIYRAKRSLWRGENKPRIEKYQPTLLEWLTEEERQKLVDVGAVAEARLPPLKELPGWSYRGARLENLGISTVGDLLAADNDKLAGELDYKPSTVARWKREVGKLIVVEMVEEK